MVKYPPASAGDVRDIGSIFGSGRSPEEGIATHSNRGGHCNPFQESHGQQSLVGYSPLSHRESDMTKAT